MEKSKKSKQRIVRNFVQTYGFDRFVQFVQEVSQGRSGQDIANELNVSRERVRQWKSTFGTIHIEYRLDPAVVDEAKETKRRMK
jgi:hypothetical protein